MQHSVSCLQVVVVLVVVALVAVDDEKPILFVLIP